MKQLMTILLLFSTVAVANTDNIINDLINVFGNNNQPRRAKKQKKFTKKDCQKKFFDNKYESDSYLCDDYTYTRLYINSVSWRTYFSCRDNIKSSNITKISCLNNSDATWLASNDYNKCIDNVTLHIDIEKGEKLCKTKNEGMIYSYKDYFKCIDRTSKLYTNKKDLNRLCKIKNFRLSTKHKNYESCYKKSINNTTPWKSLLLCSLHDDDLDYIGTKKHKSCLDKVELDNPLNSFLICSSKSDYKNAINEDLHSCINKGVESTKDNYFYLKTLAINLYTQRINTPAKSAFHWVLKDCKNDNSFFGPSAGKKNDYFSFHSDYNYHTYSRFNDFDFGGISASRLSPTNKEIYLLSDDRGFHGAPRIYNFKYSFDLNERLVLEPNKTILLSTNNNSLAMDPEGFDFINDDQLVISSELDELDGDDFLSIYNLKGSKLETIPLNDVYKPEVSSEKRCKEKSQFFSSKKKKVCKIYTESKGFQPNKSLESISISPDKKYLFTANEQPLRQDIRYRNKRKLVGKVRIAKYYKDAEGKFHEQAQFYYKLGNEVDNGLVSILSLTENKLLTLERSWNGVKKKITSKIFLVNLEDAQNLLDVGDKADEVDKKLLIDLDDIINDLSPGFRLLENFEGITFGPTLPNGKDSILLVTDNNFRESQRTLLLLLNVNLQRIMEL